ncbi:hypothetical protein L2E82_05987 [Cichorium intybus]|uniref:Uncharacterized protein n=1 Tax=Cichorium intybus TaxID=13427 RepID=A0ACB9HAZ9_CICIN|nr:hypothetical protein L2E82_05987 [Cichorium intybus]
MTAAAMPDWQHVQRKFKMVKSFNHDRVPVAKLVSTTKIIGGSYAAVLQGDIGTSTGSEEAHVSCNDESEKESDTEDTLVSGEKYMSKERCQGSNVILEKTLEDGEIPVERAPEVSDDPFGFYPLLNNQNINSMAPSPFVDDGSAHTLTHPPVYTPPCSVARQEGENGFIVENVEVDKPGDSSRPDVISDQQLSRSKKDSSAGGGNVNDIAGLPVQSQSILKRLNDLVEVGQAMGFNMEGCLKNMEQIIDYHGNQNSFQ